MKRKIFLGLLFSLSVVLMLFYSSRSLVISQVSTTEKIQDTPRMYHDGEVLKTYEDNYAAIGGAVGFGILASASLLAFIITEQKNKS